MLRNYLKTVTWDPEVTSEQRADQIRIFLADYDPEWSLVQIGAPGEGVVPITFRKRGTGDNASRIQD